MATNTGGGTTASLSNTPQAKDDSFNLVEDYNAIAWLDVMANDLGGNAKILWSLDDSATDALGATDLIGSDIGKVEATSNDTSLNGAKVWICDGKVGYDASTLSASFRAQLQALAVGEKITDSFTYAIRLSNGTLSWGTATIFYTGTNDGPDISVGTGDSASACLTETNSTLSTSGKLTVVDPDTSDTVAVSITGFSKSGNAGSLTDLQLQGMLALGQSSLAADAGSANNLDWSFASTPQTFDYLAAGESLTLTYTVTADDGHSGTDTQTVTITIKGTNDGPAIVAGGTVNGGVEEESGIYTASGSFGFTDVDSSDVHSVSATPGGSGYLGTLTPSVSNDSTGDGSGTVSWGFSVSNADLQFLGEGETRTQTYTVTVDDGHGGTASQTVTIVLTGDEDPIVVTSAAQSKSISEDGASVGGTIAFNDVDVSDTHTASAAANAANTTTLGTFNIDASVTEAANAANGSIGWSYAVNNSAAQYLAAGESVVEKYDVTFNDAHGSIVTETVTVTITGSNDGPDIRAIAGDTASHDFDETDSGLSTSGTLTVTDPDTSDTIDTSVAIAVSGNQGTLSDDDLLAMFGITGGTDADLAADTGDTNNLNWSFDSGSEAFDFLAEDQVLTLTYTLTSDDGNGGTDTQNVVITITGTNDDPVLSASVTSATYTDTAADDSFGSITGSLSTVDPDSGDTALYSVNGGAPDNSLSGYDTSASSAYGTLYLNSSTGAYKFVPDDTAIEALKTDDSASFTLTVTDGSGATDSETLTINIDGANDTPELGAVTDASYTDTAADDSFANVTGTLTSTDRDGSDSASYAVAGGSATAEPGFDQEVVTAYGTLYLDSSTGNYKFVPDDGAIEGLKTTDHVDFTVSVTDGSGDSDSDTLTITLNGVNDTPEASATNSVTTDEDTASSAVAIGASDRDSGETLTYSVKTGEEPSIGDVTFNQGAGTFTYTPDSNANGSDSFTILITDASGATTEQVVSVTVNPVNDAPESANGSGSTDEDVPLSASLPGATDVDGDSITYSLDTDAANGSAVVNADGTFTYTPNENFNGSDSFSFTVSDGHGGSNTYNYNITVDPVNDAPESANGSGSTDEDTPLSDSLPGATDVDGDSVTYALDDQAANGTAVVNADGSFTYTPDENFNGSDSFSFTVSDGHGGSNTYTYDVTVDPVNDAPVASDDSVTTAEDTPVTFDVRSNDTDVDGDALSVTKINGTAISVGSPVAITGGSISLEADGQLTFTPTANFNGTPSFNYTVSDGHGGTANATVNLTVTAVNDAPANEVPGAQTINEDGSVTFSAGNSNAIKVGDTDLNGGNLTVTLTVAHGTLSLSGTSGLAFSVGDGTTDGTMTFSGTQSAINAAMQGLVYTPTADYNGSDTLTITTNDNGNTGSGGAKSDSDTVTINLNAVADIAADSVSVNANSGPNNLDLLANDSFENAGRFISAVGSASHGTVSINNNGTAGNLADDFVVYTPDSGYTGADSFSYTVTSGGVTETATVSVAVNASDALSPTDIVFNLNPASSGFAGNGLGTGNVLGSFTAVDADSTSWTFTLGGTNASLFTLSPGGSQSSVNIAAAGNIAPGNYTFTVTATDGAGHSFTETYHVGVGTTAGDTAAAFTVTTGTDVDFGLNGQDVINGGAGDDALVGGQNNDTITGGAGADQLIGGQGNDAFVYTATSDSTSAAHDTIFDFEEAGAGDVINLTAIDANLASGGDQAFAFAGQTNAVVNNSVTWFQDAAHNQTVIQADNNGDGIADLVITLTGLHTVTSSDFGL